jgi:ribokinase
MLSRASLFCVQLEIPMRVVERAVTLAREAGVAVMLDPAPVTALPDSLLTSVAWITPNALETEMLTGTAPLDEADARRAAEMLRARGVEHVAITRGAEGCFYSGPEGSFRVDAPSVDVVDTVASGDAFNGALAAAIAGGEDVGSALERACAAGALAATRPGAQPSLPTAADVDRLLGSG